MAARGEVELHLRTGTALPAGRTVDVEEITLTAAEVEQLARFETLGLDGVR